MLSSLLPALLLAHGWAVGPTVNRFQDDFALGASIGTPTFWSDRFRVSLAGGVAWYPYGSDGGEQDWVPYGDVRLVLEVGQRAPGSQVRLYGFGGPIAYVLPGTLADEPLALGGVGGFGFEHYFAGKDGDGPVSYFVELGGVGGAFRADNQPGGPLVGNGFLATVGFRWHL